MLKQSKGKEKYVNRLAQESSPYLLQHKNNRNVFDRYKNKNLNVVFQNFQKVRPINV